ncbi:sensor histidine kinase, partial [Cytophagia bacterium CHB2]|nr:sensor histidine kinase [Cytophagia bacterium CHB2]
DVPNGSARPRASQRERIQVLPIINDLHAQLQQLHPGVTWRMQVPDSAAALADEGQLRRLLLNLLRNAIEAVNGQGEIEINATVSHAQFILTIKDNGPGISPEIAEKIFEPFFTTRPQGSGLGLALVRQLAEQNHGRIELVPGAKGAHFRLTLEVG